MTLKTEKAVGILSTAFSKKSDVMKKYLILSDTLADNKKVKAGDVVGLIDVMKLFTNIESSLNGKIKSILVNDGDVVEFDQPLIEIETS